MADNSITNKTLLSIIAFFQQRWFTIWIAALVVLLPLSLLPQTAPPGTPLLGDLLTVDKLLHFLAYGGLALAPLLFADNQRCLLLVLIVIIHSLMMEVLQTAIPGRFGSLSDIIANLAGILTAIALSVKYGKRRLQ